MDTANTPAGICNRALMAISSDAELGDPDLQEGTKEARACLRVYGPTLRQLLRSAHWNFSRFQGQLTLLNDRTGQTPNVGTGTSGMGPWRYEYAWPIDALKARFVPFSPTQQGGGAPSGNIALPNNPLMSGLGACYPFARQIPARFLVTQDQIPNVIGAPTSWDQVPDWMSAEGQGPDRQTVILTNVQNATLVYTRLVTYPSEWDSLFQEAMVAAIGEKIAMQVLPDKKFALQMRNQQIAVAKQALEQARVRDGDEGWTGVDHVPDWLRIRNSGGRSNQWGSNDSGVLGYGWEAYGFSSGTAY